MHPRIADSLQSRSKVRDRILIFRLRGLNTRSCLCDNGEPAEWLPAARKRVFGRCWLFWAWWWRRSGRCRRCRHAMSIQSYCLGDSQRHDSNSFESNWGDNQPQDGLNITQVAHWSDRSRDGSIHDRKHCDGRQAEMVCTKLKLSRIFRHSDVHVLGLAWYIKKKGIQEID
jgi:hypothetical protein